ncbi:MAG: hypothetical protein ISS45_01720 [Candidatus Omnitrophica bacterium]|nr:hypothetical protein [Candidatus Omnitrophota bacterium]
MKKSLFHIVACLGIVLLVVCFSFDRAQAGEYDKELRAAKAIEDTFSRAGALIDVALSYAEAGEKRKALKILSRAFKITKRIKSSENADTRTGLLVEIAISYAKIKEKSRALQIVKIIEDADAKESVLAEISAITQRQKETVIRPPEAPLSNGKRIYYFRCRCPKIKTAE